MASVELEELFHHKRISGSQSLVVLLLYFPFGIVLFLLRFFIGLQAVLLARLIPQKVTIRRHCLRVMCGLLGIIVTSDKKSDKRHCQVIVANLSSTFHHLAVGLVHRCVQPCVWDLQKVLVWLFGYTEMGAKKGKEELIKNCKQYLTNSNEDLPLLSFPEGASTSGEKGLLKFSTWPFSLDVNVQPVVITVRRPWFLPIRCVVIGGRWWQDLFWTMFVPYTHYRIKMLPVTEKEGENLDAYAQRVQAIMAAELGIAATRFGIMDKIEHTKRHLFQQPPVSPPSSGESSPVPASPQPTETTSLSRSLFEVSSNDHLAQLVRQVKEVLPDVPSHIIRQDLAKTKDVDLTLHNILEGSVKQGEKQVLPKPSGIIPKTLEFPKSSSQRHMSLEERKKALLELGRQRYLIRHGLEI